MFKKAVGFLYDVSRKTGKVATMIHDADILMSGDVKKITKRAVRKTVTKQSHKISREINKKIR